MFIFTLPLFNIILIMDIFIAAIIALENLQILRDYVFKSGSRSGIVPMQSFIMQI